MAMTSLDRRDRRRAMQVMDSMNAEPDLNVVKVRDLIVAALKETRVETGIGTMKWFLFSSKPERAKAKRAIQAKGSKR